MERPNKKDYLTTNQFEYNQMLCKYYEALETYIDILEKQLTIHSVVGQGEQLCDKCEKEKQLQILTDQAQDLDMGYD